MRVILAFILVVFLGASVDTESQQIDNGISVSTNIVGDGWSASVIENTIQQPDRRRYLDWYISQDGGSWFITLSYQWGDILHVTMLSFGREFEIDPVQEPPKGIDAYVARFAI